jgi:hypothetical protein
LGLRGVRPTWRSVGATAPIGHYRYRATIIIASIKKDRDHDRDDKVVIKKDRDHD